MGLWSFKMDCKIYLSDIEIMDLIEYGIVEMISGYLKRNKIVIQIGFNYG